MRIFLLILLFPFPLPGQVTDASVVFASPDEMKSYKSKEEDSYYENYRRQGFKPEQRSMAFWLQDIQFMRLTMLIVTVLCFSCDMRRSSEKRFEANIGTLLPADKTVLKDEYQDMLQDYAIIYEVELSVEANESFIEKLETLASRAVADKSCNWFWAENGFSYECEKGGTTYSVAYDTAKRRIVYRELAGGAEQHNTR